MEHKIPTSPVVLHCLAAFAHLHGQSLGCSGGTFHVATDGTVRESPAIAAALLDLRFAPEGETAPQAVFEPASGEDAAIVQAYRDALTEIALKGEELGPLVKIECLAFAGQSLGASGDQTLEFDAFGYAVIGERVYQDLRPAFGGDGSNEDAEAPQLRFVGYLKELDARQEADLESVDLDLGAPILTPIAPVATPPVAAPVTPEYDPREPDTDGMGPTQPSPAAREMAAFNAGAPLDAAVKAESVEDTKVEDTKVEDTTPAVTPSRSRSKTAKAEGK